MSEEDNEDFSRLMDELTPIVDQDFDSDTPQHIQVPMAGTDQVQPVTSQREQIDSHGSSDVLLLFRINELYYKLSSKFIFVTA